MATDVAVRASRLFFALFLTVSIGAIAMMLLPKEMARGIKAATGTAGIIIVVTQTPLIGAMPRAFVENTFGTVLGASLGILVFFFWDRVVPFVNTDYYLRLLTAPLVGAIGLAIGAALGWEGAGKLVPMTYLLVIVNNNEEDLAVAYGMYRTMGIVVGLLCSNITSIIIFQRSATEDVMDRMKGILTDLSELNRLVWAPDSLAVQGAEREKLMEISICKIHMGLNSLLGTLPLTQTECRVSGMVPPHWWFMPWAPISSCYGWRLSKPIMVKAVSSVRRVNRLLGSFWLLLSHPPADATFLEHPKIITLLKDLRFLTQAVLDGVLAAYTGLGWVDIDALAYVNSKILEAQTIMPGQIPNMLTDALPAARKLAMSLAAMNPSTGAPPPPISDEALSELLQPLLNSAEGSPSRVTANRDLGQTVFHAMPAQEVPAELLAMPKGKLSAEVWWNTFQFLLVQLAVETRALHHSVCDLINDIKPLPSDTWAAERSTPVQISGHPIQQQQQQQQQRQQQQQQQQQEHQEEQQEQRGQEEGYK